MNRITKVAKIKSYYNNTIEMSRDLIIVAYNYINKIMITHRCEFAVAFSPP